VVCKAGAYLDTAQLMSFVAARVAPHKKVRAVEFIDEIPKFQRQNPPSPA
jgi:acyl-coenzyme A synthetase/AMP-(fatty) acid ligase